MTFLYSGTMNHIIASKTMGTINPCTNNIQLEENPSPGYARKVILLINVAKIDIPIAHEGIFPLARK